MKMHEYQNKEVTKKAFRKCKKRKDGTRGCATPKRLPGEENLAGYWRRISQFQR
jgi:hypothetical protein